MQNHRGQDAWPRQRDELPAVRCKGGVARFGVGDLGPQGGVLQREKLAARLAVPEPERAVLAGRYQSFRVRAEQQEANVVRMTPL